MNDTLQATCAPLQHMEACTAGADNCCCVCHGEALEQHQARSFSRIDVPGLGFGIWCSCGWFCWTSGIRLAAEEWAAHVLDAT